MLTCMAADTGRNITIDQEADAGYLTFHDGPVEKTTDHGGFLIDRSPDGRPVGIEVLTLQRPLDTEAVMEVLAEDGTEADAEVLRPWVESFAAQIRDLDDRVPAQVPMLRDRPAQPQWGSKPPLEEVRFLTVAEVATVMRVSKMTVYRMVHAGVLPAIRVGRSYRVPERAVRDYLREASADLRALG